MHTAMLLIITLLLPAHAIAGVYWNHGVRAASISVCFVGDAVTARPARVAEILHDIQEFSNAANVRFNNRSRCPASVVQPDGTDWFDYDIRIVIPGTSVNGTGPVPGRGCPMFRTANGTYTGGNDGWGSWSNGPDELARNRSCVYNLKLGDDPWTGDPYLNHTLHEFGHALGLGHEHERADVNAGCTEQGYGGSATAYLTPYDRHSVMHYRFTSCGINGNYDNTGLSYYDRLSAHILYPEAQMVAEYSGRTVLHTAEPLVLEAGWLAAGANLAFVAKDFRWRLNGQLVSTGFQLQTTLPAGNHSLWFWHRDFLEREYSYQTTIRVLTPQMFVQTIVAPVAAALPLH
jgi:hypothetical protein